ncbi:MAG: phospho-2-dehydro-3-deoxyheptonate aldolase [Candidatus Gottesmanbacteria bacterium GW2011_GWA2_43_14]|uniref:Prephenate dehydratase n=1 Tax=Candidatus Gottesmanbacteria bacterium GW2011_GWA2_43_14 TaxID=1618443 RepID=A0A0G1DKI5_9BACT|nr:MAG: phospho-2-dehydro-3-deoxyheptonate aldolase [Candidatus Gottesmanbacteria bacterium GW2011_GWA2_43_14]
MKKIKQIFYLGIKGSNSFLAASLSAGNKVKLSGLASFEEIFRSVEKESSAAGILPLENSLSGSIYEIYDLLTDSKTFITAETEVRINHALMQKERTGLQKIRYCLSHPEVFRQCRRFFSDNPSIETVPVADTASAAKMLKELGPDTACVANPAAAAVNNLRIKKEHLEDNRNNYSRFITVGRKLKQHGNKISLMFNLKHVPGSLYKALSPYARLGLNLTKIESRPIPGRLWEYLFYVDFELNNGKHGFDEIITAMKMLTKNLKVLGRYDKYDKIKNS